MKKLLLFALVLAICITIVACNNENKTTTVDNVDQVAVDNTIRANNNVNTDSRVTETLAEINKGGGSRQIGQRYIKEISDSMYGVYYVNNGKVEGYELYAKFEDNETALRAKDEYPDVNKTVDEIKVVDDTMIVIFKPIEFEGTTVDNIKEFIK
jgi:hypothetical protein